MREQPTDDLIRELYARFGLAYYHSEVLHRGLCIILALSDLPRRDLITRLRIEEKLAQAFSLTLGEVVHALAGTLPKDCSQRLEMVLKARNFLAHHFWFDRAHLMFHADAVNELIKELDTYTELFGRLDEETSHWFESKRRELGLTEEVLNDCTTRILSGQIEDPLPSKDITKDREKKLKRKQRLVRVWEFTLPDGGKPLIFEMADGTLWQLCDVGLGWTQFTKVESDWTEHPATKPYLPAEIIGRPRDAQLWEYKFQLQKGAVLWIKPGKGFQTFQWGVKTK